MTVMGGGRHILCERYLDDSAERQAELDLCLHENLACDGVSAIHLFCEPELASSLPSSGKIHPVIRPGRATFEELFDYANRELAGQIVVICNSDIYFDDSIRFIERDDLGNAVYCLTRWDIGRDGRPTFLNRPDSFDAWAFLSPIKIRHCGFHLGLPGCDNRIAYLLAETGRRVRNPGYKIRGYHVHLSGKRNYDPRVTVPGPYLTVAPELQPIKI